MKTSLINNQIVREMRSKSCELKTNIITNHRSHNLSKLNNNKTNPFRKRLYPKK